MNPNVFREYDVRGRVDEDLTESFVYDLGRAVGTYARSQGVRTMSIGRDCRLSSETYQRRLIQGLNASGLDTIDIGLCATPMLYYSIRHLQTGGGVMVTGSHNPPEFNGFKICVGHDSIYGESIQQLRRIMETGAFDEGAGSASRADIADAYTNCLFENVRIEKRFKVVVDAGNGVGGRFALPLLEKLGCEITPIYCEPDGRFPNHFPDPTVE